MVALDGMKCPWPRISFLSLLFVKQVNNRVFGVMDAPPVFESCNGNVCTCPLQLLSCPCCGKNNTCNGATGRLVGKAALETYQCPGCFECNKEKLTPNLLPAHTLPGDPPFGLYPEGAWKLVDWDAVFLLQKTYEATTILFGTVDLIASPPTAYTSKWKARDVVHLQKLPWGNKIKTITILDHMSYKLISPTQIAIIYRIPVYLISRQFHPINVMGPKGVWHYTQEFLKISMTPGSAPVEIALKPNMYYAVIPYNSPDLVGE